MSRLRTVLLFAWVFLGGFFKWLWDNFAYDSLWAFLESKGYHEAKLTGLVTSNLPPLLLATLVIVGIYYYVRYEMRRSLIAPGGQPITDTAGRLADSSGRVSHAPERDTWIHDAVIFAIHRQWPGLGGGLKEGELAQASEAVQQMRQLAADGELLIWGRLGPQQLHVVIPQEFWVDHQINLLSAVRTEPEKTTTERTSFDASHTQYWALMVSKDQVEKVALNNNISLQEAAQIAYERAEREGWLENVVGEAPNNPQARLETFKYMMLKQAQNYAVTLHGVEPPSRQSLSIKTERVAGLYPMEGESTLKSTFRDQVVFHSVTISSSDLEKVIATYRFLATEPQSGATRGEQTLS